MVLSQYFNKIFAKALVGLIFFIPASSWADVLFEGYSKVMVGELHVGFVVQRYQFDPKAKEFSSIYYIQMNQQAGNGRESLNARCTDSFHPISYSYTFKNDNQTKTIDATFVDGKMTVNTFDGKKKTTDHKPVKKGTFLSTFLGYLMLNKGLKKGKSFKYAAVAEENGDVFSGSATILGSQKVRGLDVFKVENNFKGQFHSFLTPNGEVISTISPTANISTELQATMAEATKGHKVPIKTIKELFGGLPKGKNVLVGKTTTTTPPPTPKTEKPKGP